MKLRFRKYFHSVLDPDEFSMLDDYMSNSKNDKEITSLMKTYWDEKMEESPEDPKANPALFERIKEAIQADKQKRSQRKLKIYTWGLRAASVLVLVLITSGIFYMRTKQNLLAQQWHSITTPFGAKSKITLPDSTTIWLNAGSSLRYSNEFGTKSREVQLSGEAFFDVFHNPSILFTVKTSELTIKSYGTAFNVKSYPEEGTIETTLIEGSIGITRSSYVNTKKDEVLLRSRLNQKSFKDEIRQLSTAQEYVSIDQIQYKDLKNRVDEIVGELPERQKEIFILSRTEGLSHKEISKKLQITTKTVEYHISLAIKSLKTKLNGGELVTLFLFLISCNIK